MQTLFILRPKMFKISIILLCAAMLSACLFKGYHPPIQQGNVVTKTMVAQLRPGMSKGEVLNILGSPMLNNLFEASRWDYVYTKQIGNDPMTYQRVTVCFAEDGKVERIENSN